MQLVYVVELENAKSNISKHILYTSTERIFLTIHILQTKE